MNVKPYVPPQIVAVTFVAEHGFALSGGVLDPEQIERNLLFLQMVDDDSRQTETFNIYWEDRGDNSFFN